MSEQGWSSEFEARLRRAMAPVDPPVELELRVESRLSEIVELAAEELESWELESIKDPRNWGRALRPAAAVLIGSGAAAGLVILRTRRRRHKRRHQAHNALDLAERTLRDAAREARRVFEDVRPH